MIGWVIEVGDDRNAIVQLESKREDRVINQDHIFQIAIADDSEVFDKDSFVGLKAVLPVESKIYEGSRWVNQINDCVCILSVTRREDTHMILGATLGQTLSEVRP